MFKCTYEITTGRKQKQKINREQNIWLCCGGSNYLLSRTKLFVCLRSTYENCIVLLGAKHKRIILAVAQDIWVNNQKNVILQTYK